MTTCVGASTRRSWKYCYVVANAHTLCLLFVPLAHLKPNINNGVKYYTK